MDSLASRAKEAIMLGYATNQKAYKLWNVSKGEITVSRDVVFDEKRAPPTATKSSVDIGDITKIAVTTMNSRAVTRPAMRKKTLRIPQLMKSQNYLTNMTSKKSNRTS